MARATALTACARSPARSTSRAFPPPVRSTKPRGGAARKQREQARRALTDREALEALLAENGLPAHAARLAHEIAEPGLLLLPAGDERVRSRLGGPPLLPADEPWPGRLTFIAGIDLTELPPSALPAQGWLLCFVDLGTGDADGLIDEAPNEPELGRAPVLDGQRRRSDGTLPAPATRHRAAVPHAARGLDRRASCSSSTSMSAQTYTELAERLEAALPARHSRHWLGGHATGVQGEPLDHDTALLLSIEDDDDLGFSFLDAGTVQFRIPSDALARSRLLASDRVRRLLPSARLAQGTALSAVVKSERALRPLERSPA